MKRNTLAVVLLISTLMTSCASSNSGQHVESTTTGVRDVLESGIAAANGEEPSASVSDSATDGQNTQTDETYTRGEVDIDLTVMNPDIVYANVFGMMSSPDEYVGYTVRMKGTALSYYDEEADVTYYACFITDAAQCCSQGLEYRLSEGEYPEDNEEITIVGVFTTYYEGDNLYVAIDDAIMEP